MEKWSVIKHYRDILSTEDGYVIKNGKTKVAILYPNRYEIACQNLGFQEVYSFLNSIKDVSCERFVLDFYEDNLSIETQKFISEFEIVFVSINYEEDVLNLIKFLNAQKINIFSEERNNSDPLIIAGGALTFLNPCLLLKVADFQLLGDLEPMKEDLAYLLTHLEDREKRVNFLKNLKNSIYYKRETLAKVVFKKDKTPICSAIKTSKGEFSNEFLAEMSIGCKYSCRFCSASYIYRPYRVMDFDKLYDILENRFFSDSIGIVSAVFGDLKDIKTHLKNFYEKGKKISVSSLRIDTLDRELLFLLQKCGVKSITVAEETAADHLKKLINKDIDIDKIYKAVEDMAFCGISNLKLYYIIGLPGESLADIQLLVERVSRITELFITTQAKFHQKVGKVKVSINIFIPKPFTPMQYFPLEKKETLNKKIRFLQKELNKISNLKYDIMSYNSAYLQATLSRAEKNIEQLYRSYLETKNIKSALLGFNSNAHTFFDENYQFEWERVVEPNFQLNILKREFKSACEAIKGCL
jgi:radical SAM superfamily enzyme YgiQ (UPF0313 family)